MRGDLNHSRYRRSADIEHLELFALLQALVQLARGDGGHEWLFVRQDNFESAFPSGMAEGITGAHDFTCCEAMRDQLPRPELSGSGP